MAHTQVSEYSLWLEGRRGRRRSQGSQPLQEDAGLVAVSLEGVDRASHVLVTPGLVEAQGVRVAGPSGEPEDFRPLPRGQGLGPGEQLLADALPQKGTLNVEPIQLGSPGVRREEGMSLAMGELCEAQQVIRQLGDQDAAPGIGEEGRERLLREIPPDLPRDGRTDALGGIRIEEYLRCQDAQAERVRAGGRAVGDLAWGHEATGLGNFLPRPARFAPDLAGPGPSTASLSPSPPRSPAPGAVWDPPRRARRSSGRWPRRSWGRR